jgi:hypothetical protein
LPHREQEELTKYLKTNDDFFSNIKQYLYNTTHSEAIDINFTRKRILYINTIYAQKYSRLYLRDAYAVCIETMSGRLPIHLK